MDIENTIETVNALITSLQKEHPIVVRDDDGNEAALCLRSLGYDVEGNSVFAWCQADYR